MWCLLTLSEHAESIKVYFGQSFKESSECSKWTFILIPQKHFCFFLIKRVLTLEGNRSVHQGISSGGRSPSTKKTNVSSKMFQDTAPRKLNFSLYQGKAMSVQFDASHRENLQTLEKRIDVAHIWNVCTHTHMHTHKLKLLDISCSVSLAYFPPLIHLLYDLFISLFVAMTLFQFNTLSSWLGLSFSWFFVQREKQPPPKMFFSHVSIQ